MVIAVHLFRTYATMAGQWKRVSSLPISKRFKDGKAKANTKTVLPFYIQFCQS